MKLTVVCRLMLLLGLLASVVSAAEDVDQYNESAKAKFQQKDFDGALADLDKAIALNPYFPGSYNNRGQVKQSKGDVTGAIADYDKAIALNADDALFYFNRATAKRAKNDRDGAVADYDKVIELDPGRAQAFYNRGNIKWDRNDYDGALADYDSAIALKSDYALAYSNRAALRERKGDFVGAVADYDQLIPLRPNDPSAYNRRGNARQYRGDFDGAIEDYDKMIALAKPADRALPYVVCYRHLTLRRLHRDGESAALERAAADFKEEWIKFVTFYLTGALSEEDLIARTEAQKGRLCSADYFIGMNRLLKDDLAGAREFFEKSLKTELTSYTEFNLARAELARLSGNP